MRAVVAADGEVRWEERPDPVPSAGQALVRVRAAGVNNADLMQVAGRYPAPPGAPADIPGLELAGEVVEGAGRFRPGDRVMALLGGGGQAELAAVSTPLLLPVPPSVGWPEAGGFVEAFATAHDALFSQGGLALGERVLVTGAAGGVGTAAVQLAVATGATVVGTVRNPALRPEVAALGAETCGPGEAEGPFDVVLELVGGEGLAAAVDLLGPGGRLVVIGVGAGGRAEVDFRTLMAKRARVSASTLRRWLELDEAQFYATFYCASVTRCYPGKPASGRGDRTPAPAEQRLCAFWRDWELRLLRPELILTVGGMATARLLGLDSLTAAVGSRFEREGAAVIPLPHPSGASGWLNAPANRARLDAALVLVRQELALLPAS
jgi:NADPH:quinone reductase-like Zn-dependent oxidoreductase